MQFFFLFYDDLLLITSFSNNGFIYFPSSNSFVSLVQYNLSGNVIEQSVVYVGCCASLIIHCLALADANSPLKFIIDCPDHKCYLCVFPSLLQRTSVEIFTSVHLSS